MTEIRYDKGIEVLSRMDLPTSAAAFESLGEIAPDLARFIVEFGYGDIYPRPALDLKSRMVATIAALTCLGNATPQLKVHIRNALKAGCTREEIIEIMMQMSLYAGFPAALNALAAAKEAFARE